MTIIAQELSRKTVTAVDAVYITDYSVDCCEHSHHGFALLDCQQDV